MMLKENQKLAKEYPILEFFQYGHLSEKLQHISAPWCTLAWKVARTLPKNDETSTALRKLLEGKDAAVRAALSVRSQMKIKVKENSLVYKFFLITIYRTNNKARAQKSKYEYRQVSEGVYDLRIIGLLHGLFGITLELKEQYA